MKHQWRKKEKSPYIPKAEPELIDIPEYQFVTISGKGNPKSVLTILSFLSFIISIIYSFNSIQKSDNKWLGIAGTVLSAIGLGIFFYYLALGFLAAGLITAAIVLVVILGGG